MAIHNKISEEEKLLILSGKFTTKELAEKLNRNPQTISKIARENNFTLPKEKVWNKVDINEDFFKEINESSSYVLGFIAADGHLDIKKNRLVIQLSVKDIEHLNKIKNLMESKHEIKTYEDKQRCIFGVMSKKITNDLINLGITNNKTKNLTFPNIAENHRSSFIRGYFDGDGSFFINEGKAQGRINPELRCSIVGTFEVLKSIKEQFSNFYKKEIGSLLSQSKWYNAWKLSYSSASAIGFGDFIYQNSLDNVRLSRKYDIYNYIKNKEYKHSDFSSISVL